LILYITGPIAVRPPLQPHCPPSRAPSGGRRSTKNRSHLSMLSATANKRTYSEARMQNGIGSSAAMISRMTDGGQSNLREPKRVACTRCRQSKLRCDSSSDISPCVRCVRLGLTCERDTSYKRVNKRSKIDDLEKQVEHLRSVMGQGQRSPSSKPNSMDVSIGCSPSRSAMPHSQIPHQQLSTPDSSPLDGPPQTSCIQPESSIVNNPGGEAPQTISVPAPPRFSESPQDTSSPWPAAHMVRAIDSTALSLEEIDSMFYM